MSYKHCFDCLRWGMLISVMASTALAAQNPALPTAPPSHSESDSLLSSLRELQTQVRELQAEMAAMKHADSVIVHSTVEAAILRLSDTSLNVRVVP